MIDYEIDCTGKVVVVTGGASGMGKAISEAFHSKGAHVIVADLEKSIGSLNKTDNFSEEITAIATDVTDIASVESMVKNTVDKYKKINILVNCAGVIYKSVIENIDLAQWQKLIDINLTGPVICARAVVPFLKEAGWGRIINISSVGAFQGTLEYSAYNASKAGLNALTRVWAMELIDYNITVNSICPFYTKTPMLQKNLIERKCSLENISEEEAIKKVIESLPEKRFLKPEEIAFAALFLASDLAYGINGHSLIISQGAVLN